MSEELNVTQEAVPSRVRLVVAQVGAKFIEIDADGITLRDLPGFDSELTYMVGAEVVGPDFVLRPGMQLFASQPHDNG